MLIYRFVSGLGFTLILFFAWFFSSNRKGVRWSPVVFGILSAIVLAVVCIEAPVVVRVLRAVHEGLSDLWTALTLGIKNLFPTFDVRAAVKVQKLFRSNSLTTLFVPAAIKLLLLTVVFGVLHRKGALTRIVRSVGAVSFRVGLTGVEGTAILCNSFWGVESMIFVLPWLPRASRSELCTIIAAGMAAAASNPFLSIIINKSTHLNLLVVAGAFVSVPAAVALSKLLSPASAPIDTNSENDVERTASEGLIESAVRYAGVGLRIIASALVAVFLVLGCAAAADLVLKAAGSAIVNMTGIEMSWSTRGLLTWICYPLALLSGVPVQEVYSTAEIFSEKILRTEWTALRALALAAKDHVLDHPRTIGIVAFAMGGFVNLTSAAIFSGVAIGIAPKRARDVVGVLPRAFLAAFLACLIAGCLCGVIFTTPDALHAGR